MIGKHISIQKIIPFCLLFIICLTLTNSDFFIYKSIAAFYGYCVSITVFSITILLVLSFERRLINIPAFPSLWFFITIILYAIVNALIFNEINLKHYYLICSSLFFIGSFLAFHARKINMKQLFNGIMLLASLEAVICIFQYLGFMEVQNGYFKATGTWANPNVTAMFISMAFPTVITLFNSKRRLSKGLGIIVSILLIIALAILKCRAAFICMSMSIIYLLNYKFRIIAWMSKKKNILKSFTAIIIVILFGGLLGNQLYKSKQASADGRILIWKLSSTMVSKEPLLGYGYGNFEKIYNLEQATYFGNKFGTSLERVNAGHVKTAYNEFIEHTIEGGVIGVILLLGVFVSLLFFQPIQPIGIQKKMIEQKSTHNKIIVEKSIYAISAYAGIVGFVVMSLFNFTLLAVPAFCLFIIYAAITSEEYISNKIQKPIAKIKILYFIPAYVIMVPCVILASYCCIIIFTKANADLKNKDAKNFALQGKFKEAEYLLKGLETKISDFDGYWINYGNVLFAQGKYNEALNKFNAAKNCSSNPDIYQMSGLCYEKLGGIDSAIYNFKLAGNMVPNLFLPRYRLMNLYVKKRDTLNAIQMARSILKSKPKIESEQTKIYQSNARQLIKQYKLK